MRSSICATCCGQKRILEIDCPESCGYLKAGRNKDIEDRVKQYQSMDQADFKKARRIIDDYADVVAALEFQIAHARLADRALTDKDVGRAVQALVETYRTEESGILYERTLDDPKIDSLRRELKEVIEFFRSPGGEQNKGIIDLENLRLPLSAAIECLEYILLMIQLSRNRGGSALAYVDFLARTIPRGEKRGSLMLPGDLGL